MHKKSLVILIALLALSLLAGCPKKATPTGMEENGTPAYRAATTEEPALFGELRDEHAKVRDMLTDLEKVTDQDGATKKLEELREALVPHIRAEESVLYTAVASTVGQDMIKTAITEHRAASQMLTQLQGIPVTDAAFATKLAALKQGIATHIAREEGQMFPMATRAMTSQQWDDLQDRFDQTKETTLDTLKQGGAARTGTGDLTMPDTTGRATTNDTTGRTGTAAPTTPGY